MKFKQYDVVKLKGWNVPPKAVEDQFNLRLPVVGDIAVIIEVYTEPPGYELECSDDAGITQWLIAFQPLDIELELIG
ncbi:hypothetical protein [Herbaspirillum robiniae]|uniref:DUF4926 domain-containing protein n=1 Tax=Herbaspirillum robiniae TaxID=2014887 RepID=A0A246WPA5_9BURK|nr:hypothetical protein [Herbaspirillum robiniae]OWY27391.1 hypothetical protein CEJ42_20305 [Herbaspirillum robiniae]